ncbi:MAG: hypothetical protein Q8P22_11855 [Chloroflexota bacterium]|nr:hypothetical protein [Chloroflexota bacterium]
MDIEADASFYERYRFAVPVLAVEGEPLLAAPLGEERVREVLRAVLEAVEKDCCSPFDKLRASGLRCLHTSARGEPVEPRAEREGFSTASFLGDGSR